MPKQSEFEQQIESIEGLVRELENSADPALSSKARQLVQALMSLHGMCLERMLEMVRQTGAAGQSIIESLAEDEKVRSLLLLYDLHPFSLEARVAQAIEKTEPYLRSHGASAGLLGVDDTGGIRVRVEGNGNGCPSTATNLKSILEQAIRDAAPDATSIQFEGSLEEHKPPLGFVPLSSLQTAAAMVPISTLEGRVAK